MLPSLLVDSGIMLRLLLLVLLVLTDGMCVSLLWCEMTVVVLAVVKLLITFVAIVAADAVTAAEYDSGGGDIGDDGAAIAIGEIASGILFFFSPLLLLLPKLLPPTLRRSIIRRSYGISPDKIFSTRSRNFSR